MTKTNDDKHSAGGPGKSARKGHLDPEDKGNKPSQEQAGRVTSPRGPDGRTADQKGSP